MLCFNSLKKDAPLAVVKDVAQSCTTTTQIATLEVTIMAPTRANKQTRIASLPTTMILKMINLMTIIVINLEEIIDNEVIMIGRVMEITEVTMIEVIVGGKVTEIETMIGETGIMTAKPKITVIRTIEGTDLGETEMITEVKEVEATVETEVTMITMVPTIEDAEETVMSLAMTRMKNQRRERFIFRQNTITTIYLETMCRWG